MNRGNLGPSCPYLVSRFGHRRSLSRGSSALFAIGFVSRFVIKTGTVFCLSVRGAWARAGQIPFSVPRMRFAIAIDPLLKTNGRALALVGRLVSHLSHLVWFCCEIWMPMASFQRPVPRNPRLGVTRRVPKFRLDPRCMGRGARPLVDGSAREDCASLTTYNHCPRSGQDCQGRSLPCLSIPFRTARGNGQSLDGHAWRESAYAPKGSVSESARRLASAIAPTLIKPDRLWFVKRA